MLKTGSLKSVILNEHFDLNIQMIKKYGIEDGNPL
jgi:hypothetical protein